MRQGDCKKPHAPVIPPSAVRRARSGHNPERQRQTPKARRRGATSRATRRAVELAVHAVGLALAGGLAWFSLRLVWQSHAFHDISTGLDATPLWIPQLGMAAGTVLLVLALAVQFVEHLRGQPAPAAPGDEPARIE